MKSESDTKLVSSGTGADSELADSIQEVSSLECRLRANMLEACGLEANWGVDWRQADSEAEKKLADPNTSWLGNILVNSQRASRPDAA